MDSITIKVGGMSCQGCVKNVTTVLMALPGVAGAEVSLDAGEAQVRYDGLQVSPAALREAIEAAGFDAE